MREEAAVIAQTHSGDLARAQAALNLVQQQIRYIYVGLDGGNLSPASADETWERRYGDCKGKTVMLLALLRELGIEAQAILASNALSTDGLDMRLAGPEQFDHVLVRAQIDGKSYFLDGTLPAVISARPKPFLPYKWVLPLSYAGDDIERIPDRPYALPQEMGLIEIDARAGFDAPVRRVSTTVARGPKGLAQHIRFSSVSANQLEAALRSELTGTTQWNTIDSVDYRFDRETQASILTISGSGPGGWEDEGDGSYRMFLPGGGFTPPGRLQRGPDQFPDIPFYNEPDYSCHATTVRLPEGTDLANWSSNRTFYTEIFGTTYYRMMEKRGDLTFRLVTGSRVETPEISPERAAQDNARLADFENSKAVLTYDPKREVKSGSGLRPVPATYEIDWTGKGAPCLPPDVLSK